MIDIKLDWNQEILKTIHKSFEKAFQLKDRDLFKIYNSLRSAKFLSTVATLIYRNTKIEYRNQNLKKNVQRVTKTGKKKRGEWLLDTSITKVQSVHDEPRSDKQSQINMEIIWAIESESSTNIHEFSNDFGKLICINSKNLLYLQGLDQLSLRGRIGFMETRLETSNRIINSVNIDFDRFYFGFWPSPANIDKKSRRRGVSIWDLKEDFDSWIVLNGFNKSKRKFELISENKNSG